MGEIDNTSCSAARLVSVKVICFAPAEAVTVYVPAKALAEIPLRVAMPLVSETAVKAPLPAIEAPVVGAENVTRTSATALFKASTTSTERSAKGWLILALCALPLFKIKDMARACSSLSSSMTSPLVAAALLLKPERLGPKKALASPDVVPPSAKANLSLLLTRALNA